MTKVCLGRKTALAIGVLFGLAQAGLAADGGRTLMRYPTLHGDTVVFVAHGNLWQVAKSGGTARRLTADPGLDLMPRYSPDGRWIAFTASYQGNRDVYVIPANGGPAKRLTFHSDTEAKAPLRWGPDNMVVTWTPDSRNIVFMSRREAWNTWYGRLFRVSVDGGLPEALPLDRGGMMTYSPDGKSIAYNRIFRNFRTWKRYDGGLAQDVYTYDFAAKKLTRITDWKGTDTDPMWAGRKIYFLSDRDAHRRANIWSYDLDSKKFAEVTHFTDYDVDFPSLGDSGIVFQQGGHLWVIDLATEKLARLDVAVPDDGLRTSPRYVDASKFVGGYALAPNGKRALFAARGDLITVPAEHGATRDLTQTSGAQEENPSWSPDGKTVAYVTDARAWQQQIAVRPSAGGPEKILTDFSHGVFYTPVWSPDGKRLAFSDANHGLWLLSVDGGKPKKIADSGYDEIRDEAFSPDGRWIAYSVARANQMRGIRLYDIAGGKATDVSDPRANDRNPVFSPNGKYLYFVSDRHENPTFSETELNIATLKMAGIYVTTLGKNEASAFAPRSDEGAVTAKKDDKPTPWKPEASKPVSIDVDGLMARAVPLPIPAADIAAIDAREGKIFYQTVPLASIDGPLPGEESALHVYDLAAREDKVVLTGIKDYSLSADGTKVLYQMTGKKEYSIADAKPKAEGKALDLSRMRIRLDPTAEWKEIFERSWRLERDLFFNPKMNGVDWQKVHDAYAELVPLAGSREDINYIVGEMQGELANSHTYVGGGDDGDATPAVPTALLGVDFALDAASERYRFAKIYAGDNTRPEYRSPLTEPGSIVHEGEYLLAVNGTPLKAPTNPYSLFVGIGGQPIALTVASSPNGKARTVMVQPIDNEVGVREQDWIDRNRKLVDRLSGGKIGYIYLSDMSELGLKQFIRQFYPQTDKQALIVDDRWNGGGFIDPIVLERLRRVLVGMSTNRERAAMPEPGQLLSGPKATLINNYSASDGDIFPYYFRKYGLGPLIGTRTWGGVRGIRGEWEMADGGYITVPEFSLYGLKSEWIIENHGVEPDIEVDTEPADLLAGRDAQIEAAVSYLMEALKKNPGGMPEPPPPTPPYPPQGMVPPASH